MPNSDNSLRSISPVEIKKHLIVKEIKGNKYYYTKDKFDFDLGSYRGTRVKEIYVCPINCSDAELKYSYCLSRNKAISELFDFLYELSAKHHSSKYLTKEERRSLEMIRLGYNIILREYGDGDLKRYEESVYTKYVYGTTSIEGNTYTLRETDLTLNEGVTVGGKEKREFHEIENYGKLKEYIDSKKNIKINLKTIKEIHEIIMSNIDTDSARYLRVIDVGIRGTNFEPLQGVLVKEAMEKLIEWYIKREEKIHPIVLATRFHQKFEEIHPFKDGNGRVGRELVRLIFEINGYPTIFVDKNNREKYLKSLDEGNSGDYKPLLSFFVNNILDVHNGLLEKAKIRLSKSLTEMENFCKSCLNQKECDKVILNKTK